MSSGKSRNPFPKLSPGLRTVSRFLFSGALNTLLTFSLYWLLLTFMDYQLAYAASFFVGLVISYLLNTSLVFKVAHSWARVVLFPIVYVGSYAVGALVLDMSVKRLGIDPRIAPVLSIAVTVPLTFLLSSLVLTGRTPFTRWRGD